MTLDRAAGLRDDPAWIDARLNDPDVAIIPMWRERCLANGDAPIVLGSGTASTVRAAANCVAFLGLDHHGPRFTADLSSLDEPTALRLCEADRTVDARDLVPTLPAAAAGALAYARGLLHWHRHQQFCGTCGGPTEASRSGHHRSCRTCDRQLFPRIEPAVIVLVERVDEPRRCVLARAHGSDADRFSTLAGFLEVGESLEDAVRREVAEETGSTVACGKT
jgi:NAD+ diphosphatase